MKLTTHPVLSATRFAAAAVLLLSTALSQAQAAAELSLKGTSSATRYAADSEIRLSVLGFSDAGTAEAFVRRYSDYLEQPEARTSEEADGDEGEAATQTFPQFLREQETRGYLFTQEATGYTIKYAWKDPAADGRMVFVVTPALKTLNPYMWNQAGEDGAAFTVLELRQEDSDHWLLKADTDTTAEVTADGQALQLRDFDNTGTFATLRDNTPYYLKGSS